jgi:hypothetical protein
MIPTTRSRSNKLELAGNIHGRWKQYSSRNHTVPGTVLLLIFPVTGITQEVVRFLTETNCNAAVSTLKLTETTRIRIETYGMPNRILFPFLSIKNPLT